MARETFKTSDASAQKALIWADIVNVETAFDRAEKVKPCPVGSSLVCCHHCHMGPCRIVGPDAEEKGRGICGATLPVVVARNFARMVAAGASAHSDHARDIAHTLLATAQGKVKDFHIKDIDKLHAVADYLGINTNRSKEDIAEDVARTFLEQFGQQDGEIICGTIAPPERQEIWRKYGVFPRGIDREIVETLHRTTMGVDQEPENILLAAARTALADGWGGSICSSDLSDILMGTPTQLHSKVSYGIFEQDMVNVVIHGHEPTLASMILEVYDTPEIIAYAQAKGAKGINLVGMCCTANEVMMRSGVSNAGGFLHQELIMMTGFIEAIVVDVQCIMPSLAQVAKSFHTKVVTTSRKGKMIDALHIEFEEHKGREIAMEICKLAIDNYPNRMTKGSRAHKTTDCIVGFSREYLGNLLGNGENQTFKPLNDAIVSGLVRGVVGIVGCNNPRYNQDSLHILMARECIKNDILVVQTGCAAAASASAGFMDPDYALDVAGPGLRHVCGAFNIPPVLHLGSCVDNARILMIITQIAQELGLKDTGGLPCVGLAPEWMSEKALTIGMYFVASGVPVIFCSEKSPVASSSVVKNIMENTFTNIFKAGFYFETNPMKIVDMTLSMIDKAREKLNISKYRRKTFAEEVRDIMNG
jgi:carbon-monoxide dehydrogenase catalytic subunit